MSKARIKKDRIQNLRDFQRPFLTMLFSTAYVICTIVVLVCAIIWLFKHSTEVDFLKLVPVLMGIVALLGTPLGAMLGYHFAKSTMRDSKNEKPEP